MTRDEQPNGGGVELTSVAAVTPPEEEEPVLEPDGLHDEHRPLRDAQDSSADYKAMYMSLDPSRY